MSREGARCRALADMRQLDDVLGGGAAIVLGGCPMIVLHAERRAVPPDGQPPANSTDPVIPGPQPRSMRAR